MFALAMAVVVEESFAASLEFAVDAALEVVDLNLQLEYLAYFGGQMKSWGKMEEAKTVIHLQACEERVAAVLAFVLVLYFGDLIDFGYSALF